LARRGSEVSSKRFSKGEGSDLESWISCKVSNSGCGRKPKKFRAKKMREIMNMKKKAGMI